MSCHRCGARGHQQCDRYRLQRPVVCPRDIGPRDHGAGPDPDRQVGMQLCAEALRGNDARFADAPAAAADARFVELDFHAGDGR